MTAHPNDAHDHARTIRSFVHEFNNLLLSIGGHCELLIQQSLPGSAERADLLAIASASERAAALTARLRTYAVEHARAATPPPAPCSPSTHDAEA